jgi:hypothetical protein
MFNQFARYEDAFRDWRRDGMPCLKADSYQYIAFLTSTDDDQTARAGSKDAAREAARNDGTSR